MKIIGATFEGLRRASRAPHLVLALWAMNLVVAAPLAILMLESIHSFTAQSRYDEALLEGFDTGWYAEFSSSGVALAESFTPSHVGVGAWLANLDRWWDQRVFSEEPVILATAGLFMVLWLLVLGGVLEAVREGAPRPRLPTVLADGLGFFPRLLRLSLVVGVGYYGVFRFARWLFPEIQRMTAAWTSERSVLLYNLAAAVLVVALIALLRVVSDYAKIALVVERRRSALLAVVRGLRFVLGRPAGAMGVAGAYGLLGVLLLVAYSKLAPGARDATPVAVVFAFGVSQVFLFGKQALRVALLGSEMSFFETNG